MDSIDAEVQSFTLPADVSRRAFLATGIVAGFTLTVTPTRASR